MKNQKIKNGEVSLVLNTRFYSYNAVLQAAKDYVDACWVFIDGDAEDKLLVTLKPKSKKIDIKTLGYEFSNYVLGLMQNAVF